MDAVTIGTVLAAVSGGAGATLGGQVWDGVVALVRRPFRRAQHGGGTTATGSDGTAELAALRSAPGDEQRAAALATVLVARAAADQEFAQDLGAWWETARHVAVSGDVTNTITGGTQYGPVIQGRDFTGLTFNTLPPPRPEPPHEPRT
jgi:hypothetical protein